MGDALGRGMRAVRGREGVVDVEIAERRHRLGELGIVLLLAAVEARVLEHADVARQHGRDRPLRLRALAILDEADRPARQPVQRRTSCAVDMSGRASPLGRPKCDSSSTIAPRSLSSSDRRQLPRAAACRR